ncbi:MAG: BrnT family toxin [Steroidobacteraceae bacterium]
MAKGGFSGFAWDEGNRRKCEKHGASLAEVEYVLAHAESVILPDLKNYRIESRFLAIGRTEKGRFMFVVFTPRSSAGATLLRPISARYMHRKEVSKYEQEIARAQKRPGGREFP